ncbi:hypothetical protein ACHAW6_006021 [Cyclotella cf. meneghiniana]
MSILQGRRFFLGFLLLVAIAVLSTSSLPAAYAQESDVASSEAEVDASGEIHVVEETTEDDGSAAAEAEAEAAEAAAEAARIAEEARAKAAAEAEAAAAKLKAEAEAAAAALAEEAAKAAAETKAFATGVTESAKEKAMAFFGKAKDISPEKVKKIAAGALGVWGIAAGAGWVMNNLGGDDN